jgi:hypothetical protein
MNIPAHQCGCPLLHCIPKQYPHHLNEAFFWCVQCSCAIIQPRELVVQNNLQKYEQPQNQIPNYKNY